MVYFVKITDQGQISIPAEIRRTLGGKNLIVEFNSKKKEFTAREAPNILKLRGKLKYKAIKGKTLDQIIDIENKAIAEAAVEKYLGKQK